MFHPMKTRQKSKGQTTAWDWQNKNEKKKQSKNQYMIYKSQGLQCCQALKSFLKGPSFRSFAASVNARNLLNPVVAAPRPSAAALVSTSSLEAISPAEAGFDIRATVGAVGRGMGGAAGGGIEGCVIPGPCLLKSSSMLCWSAFLRPCKIHAQISSVKDIELSLIIQLVILLEKTKFVLNGVNSTCIEYKAPVLWRGIVNIHYAQNRNCTALMQCLLRSGHQLVLKVSLLEFLKVLTSVWLMEGARMSHVKNKLMQIGKEELIMTLSSRIRWNSMGVPSGSNAR